MNKRIEYDFFVWCSDFENYRGEGILARIFLEKFSFNSNKKFFVNTPGSSYLFYKNNITPVVGLFCIFYKTMIHIKYLV
jgi:hypothetical protein